MTKWQFKDEYCGDEWQDISEDNVAHGCNDPELIAESLAEQKFDDGDYNANMFRFKVSIRNTETNKEWSFTVTAESTINFYARERKDV